MNGLSDTRPEDMMTHRLLERRAARAPDATFFTWQDRAYTFGEVDALANRLARNLAARGIGKGSTVAVLMGSSPEYLALWFGLAKLGAIEAPVNTAYRGDLLVHVLTTSCATACVSDADYAGAIAEVAGAMALRRLFVLGPHGSLATGDLAVEPLEPLLSAGDTSHPGAAVSYEEIGGIIFTSGTTGPSKGVMMSHHYLAAYGLMYAEINRLAADDVVFNYLPFFHIGAKFLTVATLVCGGRMHLVPRLSISSFWDEVRAQGVTNFVAVGGVCNMLLGRPPRADDAETTIRTIYAVPDPAEIHEELEQRFGCELTTVYGSTEIGLPLFRQAGGDYRPGSCGRASPYYEVAIVDERDQPVPVGEVGEIVVRPRRPLLIGSGYVGMAERTVAAWRNLWLHSGDRARMDEDGWYFFEDRLTDSIRRRGENISSSEVEQLVCKHPAVAEAVAVPAPSEIGEDEVWILAILREGYQATHEELLLHCERTMPYFMIPRFIEIVTELPRTPTAKVEKYKLRSAGPGERTWDRDRNGWTLTRQGLKSAATSSST